MTHLNNNGASDFLWDPLYGSIEIMSEAALQTWTQSHAEQLPVLSAFAKLVSRSVHGVLAQVHSGWILSRLHPLESLRDASFCEQLLTILSQFPDLNVDDIHRNLYTATTLRAMTMLCDNTRTAMYYKVIKF